MPGRIPGTENEELAKVEDGMTQSVEKAAWWSTTAIRYLGWG